MEFAFTEEQQMIRETAESFLADVSTSAAIRAAMATETGYSPELWQRICSELCFQSITIPEAHGGMGLGFVELVAVMEQMGRYLLCAPYFSTVCLAGSALLLSGNEARQGEVFSKILEGGTATLAFTATGKRGLEGITATFRKEQGKRVLNGNYRFVVDGHSADTLILSAREEAAPQNIALFVACLDVLPQHFDFDCHSVAGLQNEGRRTLQREVFDEPFGKRGGRQKPARLRCRAVGARRIRHDIQ